MLTIIIIIKNYSLVKSLEARVAFNISWIHA